MNADKKSKDSLQTFGVSKKQKKTSARKRTHLLEVIPVPVPPGSDHPPPPYGNGLLPVHEFTMGLIAPKGKGKTTTIINLLEFYSGYFHKIFVLSPTIKSDIKWKFAKELDVLVSFDERRSLERETLAFVSP